jgi:transcriptional regulator with XRE-family HTH domain
MQDVGDWGSARKAIGERIKQAVAVRGITLRELSASTAIPYSTLLGYLGGKHEMPIHALLSIAATLRVPTDWLLFGPHMKLDESVVEKLQELHSLMQHFNTDEPIALPFVIAGLYGYALNSEFGPEAALDVLLSSRDQVIAALELARYARTKGKP